MASKHIAAAIAAILCVANTMVSHAGAYVYATNRDNPDTITHPSTFNGSGGNITVRICIDPSSPNAADMELPLQNNIRAYNRMQPVLGNVTTGGANSVPGSAIDFESVSLHEVGHCIGLAHPNLANESQVGTAEQDATKTLDGQNNMFDVSDNGADNIWGSADDIRGDDVNLHWFRISNNDPFTIDTVVDSSTYSVDIADLPAGDIFAANGSRALASSLGYPQSEAVMQQGTFFGETQRELGHDDVATLSYAASGLDETSGNSDDYTITLEYGGISSTNCDISMSITSTPGLAFCGTTYSVGANRVSGDHYRIKNPYIEFGDSFNWYFNTVPANQAPDLATVGDQSVIEDQMLDVALSATDADGDQITLSSSTLPAFMVLVDNGDGTGELQIDPVAGDSGSYPVTITASDDGLPVQSSDEAITVTITAALDSDGDGIDDSLDNCTLVSNPAQVDADGDGHGNLCDADLNNSCGPVNILDLNAFSVVFGTVDAVADLNASGGPVNILDLFVFKAAFGIQPGPSAPGALCP